MIAKAQVVVTPVIDDGQRKVASVTQQIIDTLRRLSDKAFADRNNATIRDAALSIAWLMRGWSI